MLNPLQINTPKWKKKKPGELQLQPGLPWALNEWHFWQLSVQHYKTQELDFKRPLVQTQRSLIEGTDAMKGKNELCRRAAVTALAKHCRTRQLTPHKTTCHNKDSFTGAACQPTDPAPGVTAPVCCSICCSSNAPGSCVWPRETD